MKRVIGIDLGTTNSSVAFMDGDEPTIIPNDRGNRITPSVVAFGDRNEILVGESAKNQAVINAERTVVAVKRFMGEDKTFVIDGRRCTPEDISSYILKKLKKDAESYLGEEIREAVITVPAHFSERQRRATQEAGRLAGLKVRRVLNEPTAAALAYAYRARGVKNILVYDLGGGTFDVTCLRKEGKVYTVKATSGNNRLGGIDFDSRLLERVLGRFEKESGLDLRRDKVVLQQLRDQAENAKIELSSRDSALIALPFVSGSNKPIHLNCSLTRKEFEALISDLIEETINLTAKALRDAGMKSGDVDTLILSGGSSRIPFVQTRLHQEFRFRVEKKVNPDEIVALGAAVQAGLLEGTSEDIVLRDVTAYALGVEIDGDRFIELVPRNTTLPVESRKVFTTVEDRQTSVEVHVLQGESKRASENVSLGRFLLAGIRSGARGDPRIEVVFAIDVDGLVTVRAKDEDTRAEQRMTVVPAADRESKGDVSSVLNLKARMNALLDRVSRIADTYRSSLDGGFRREIEELVKLTHSAILKEDVGEMKRNQAALEIIIGELKERVPKAEIQL